MADHIPCRSSSPAGRGKSRRRPGHRRVLPKGRKIPASAAYSRIRSALTKKPSSFDEGFSNSSLTMSYFHTGTRTIIGAEAFHCPVRDGKEWDHLAMVIRLNRSPSHFLDETANSQSRSGDVSSHDYQIFLIAHKNSA